MIALPKKRQRVRSGILRGPQREWPRHRKFIRSFVCVVSVKDPGTCEGMIECAHYRTAANSGKDLKPGDWWCFPCCTKHHRLQHSIGEPEFMRRYNLDLPAICKKFAELSRVPEVKEFAKTMRGADAASRSTPVTGQDTRGLGGDR